MSFAAYIQIEAVPLLSLAIVLYMSVQKFHGTQNMRRFRLLVVLIMCILAVDTLNWHMAVRPDCYAEWMVWLSNILYFLLTEVIAFTWFSYVLYQTNGNTLSAGQRLSVKLSLIPLLLVCAVIITSPWNKIIFYIDPTDNSYHRGAFNILQLLCGFGFMAASSVIAYVRSKKTPLTEQKNEYLFLCHSTFLPLVGGTLQMINYDFIFLWPFTAATVFLIYMDYQRHQIAVDALTSLNNRGTLERYLQQRAADREPNWQLLMADIDHFKSINDKYGHAEGDRALQITAQSFRNVFGKSDAFLSRYGGDEFVIVANFASEEGLNTAIAQCQEYISDETHKLRLPYDIQISVGHARFESTAATPVSWLLQQADRDMYEQKRRKA